MLHSIHYYPVLKIEVGIEDTTGEWTTDIYWISRKNDPFLIIGKNEKNAYYKEM